MPPSLDCSVFSVRSVFSLGIQHLECADNIFSPYSGGDPLYEANRADVTALAKEIKERYPKKDIWVYTGYEWESVCDLELMDYTDVVVDGRFILAQRDVTLEWKGSPNQRVIDVKKTRARGEVVLFGEK